MLNTVASILSKKFPSPDKDKPVSISKKQLSLLMILFALGFSNAGCALFLIGGGAAAGGYAISEDEIEGLSDRPIDKVYDTLEDVLGQKGLITARSRTTRTLEAVIQDSEVRATVERVTTASVRFRIKARRADGLFPDRGLAQKLVNEVYQRL